MSDFCDRSFEWRASTSDDSDGLTLEGYAAVFDQWTEINDFEGRYLESISRGAFRKTLRERKDRVVLQYDHGQHPLLGSLPVGQIESLREDAHGLYVKARLHDNWMTQPLRDGIASGAVKDMSFRFRPLKERIEDPKTAKDIPKRTLTEVALFELGPVAFGAYEGTSVGLRAWADVAPAEFRSAFLVDEDGADEGDDTVVELAERAAATLDDQSTSASAGCESTEDPTEAAAEVEPARTTRQDRRHMAAVLRGMQNADAA